MPMASASEAPPSAFRGLPSRNDSRPSRPARDAVACEKHFGRKAGSVMRVTMRASAPATYSGQWPRESVGDPGEIRGFIARSALPLQLLSTASSTAASAQLDRDLEAVLVAQQDGAEAVLWIAHEGGVVGVLGLVSLDVVADHDG